MKFIVPPGGFAGHNQMTPASRAALGRVGQSATRVGARRKRATTSTRTTRTSSTRRTRTSSTRRASSGRKMKFGSPAWQKKYKVGKYRK